MAKFRQQKIDEEIKRELSSLIPSLKDPRLDGLLISVTGVEVTRDLKYAKVFVSILADADRKKEVIKGLESSGGFLRKMLGERIKVRYTPLLSFVSDNSIEYGTHINKIINDLNIKGDNDEEDS